MTESNNAGRRSALRLVLMLGVVVTGVVIIAIAIPLQQRLDPSSSEESVNSDPSSMSSSQSSDDSAGDMPESGPSGSSTSASSPARVPVQGGLVLAEAMNGQAAIDALGENITRVADRAGMSVDELTELLLRSPSAYVTPQGGIVYRDGFGR